MRVYARVCATDFTLIRHSKQEQIFATFLSASKSSTGTVILVIEDVNDNKPTLPAGELLICEKEGERGSTVVVAEDKDAGHYSAPFSFSLPPDNDGKWALESLNGRWWRNKSGFIIQSRLRRCF